MRVAVVVVIAVFLALGVAIAVRTPAYEAADEGGHVQNVEALASGHWYRMRSTCRARRGVLYFENCQGDEAHQPPLYYLLAAGWQRALGVGARQPFRGALNTTGRPGFFANHPDRGLLIVLRVFNLILGGLAILLAYLTARRVTRDLWTPVVCAGLVAFLPGFVFHTAFVTNDNLVTTLGALLTYMAIRYLQGSAWAMVAVGGVVGLLVTTKLTTLPMAGVVLVLAALMRRPLSAVIGVGAAIVVAAPFLVANAVRYDDPLARSATEHYLQTIGSLGTGPGNSYVVHDPLHFVVVTVPQRIVDSFWYSSDWNAYHWPTALCWVFVAASVVAMLGLLGRHVDRRLLLTLGSLVVLAFVGVWVTAFQTNGFQGRYAYVGLSAMALLAALGLERWRPTVRALWPLAGLVGCVVAVQLDVLSVRWA